MQWTVKPQQQVSNAHNDQCGDVACPHSHISRWLTLEERRLGEIARCGGSTLHAHCSTFHPQCSTKHPHYIHIRIFQDDWPRRRERTWWNCEMWRCGGSTLHPHCSTLHTHKIHIPHITYTFLHITSSTLHPHSSAWHTHNIHIAPHYIHIPPYCIHFPPHNIHIPPHYIHIPPHNIRIPPHHIHIFNFEKWMDHITPTCSMWKCGFPYNFKVEMYLNIPSLPLSKNLIHNIQTLCLDPMGIFRKWHTFRFRFSDNDNILSVSFPRKNLPDYFPWTKNVIKKGFLNI